MQGHMHVHRWTACQLGGAMQGHMHVHVCTLVDCMSIGWGRARTYARTCTYIGGLHVNWVGPCKDICTYIGGLHVNWVGPCKDMHVHVGMLSMCGRMSVVEMCGQDDSMSNGWGYTTTICMYMNVG